MQSLHDAQAFEDSRLEMAKVEALVFPLASRQHETGNETWEDDLVSVDEFSSISRDIVNHHVTYGASPVCLAVDTKAIYFGMSNSVILSFDHFGVHRGILPPSSSSSSPAVTSIDSIQNSLVVAGYEDGSLVLFEDGSRALEIPAPNDSSSGVFCTRFFNRGVLIFIDSLGVAWLVKLSKVFLLGYKCEKILLLDGQQFGPVFACRVLEGFGFALACLTQTLVVKVDLSDSGNGSPTARIVSKWQGLADPRSFALAFHPQAMFQRNRAPAFLLLRCNGSYCEALDLSTLLPTTAYKSPNKSTVFVQVGFVSNTCAALLDSAYMLEIVDLKTSLLVGRRNLTLIQFTPFVFPSHPDFQSLDNSVRSCNLHLYCLGLTELCKVCISPWQLRVDNLVLSGQWMEALSLSLQHQKTIEEQEIGSRLLTNYLFANPLHADIALVCIEYALAIHRPELIFTLLLDAFAQMNQTNELLQVSLLLVMQGKLPCAIPPHFFALLLEYVLCKHPTWLELFFLSLHELPVYDLDGCIRLCRDRKLFSALCKFYTTVLQDFAAPCVLAVGWMKQDTNLGYRFLLYLSYSLLGVEFPTGITPLQDLPAVHTALLNMFFLSPVVANTNETTGALAACLEFDPECFLKLFQDCIFHSAQVSQCLDRLLEVGGELPCVLLFCANCMCAIKQDHTTRPQVFAYMHTMHPELLVEFIQRYPGDLEWYMKQHSLQSIKQVEVGLLIKRMQLQLHPNSFDLVQDVFHLLLERADGNGVRDFIREQQPLSVEFKQLLAAHSRQLVQLEHNHELVTLLFEMDPDLLLEHLTDEDKYKMLKPVIGSFGGEVTLEMANTFVELLCKHDPAMAYDWLSRNEGRYNIDMALEICTRHSIRNARAYLLERLGKVSEALDLVLEDKVGLETSLPVAIKLCESFGSEQEWFKLLDCCLGQPEWMAKVLSAMIPATGIDPKRISNRLSDPQDLLYVLKWFQRERAIWHLARNSLREDLNRFEHQSRAHKAKAVKLPRNATNKVEWSATNHSMRIGARVNAIRVSGFEDYDALELSWTATTSSALSRSLLLGSEYALDLEPPKGLLAMLSCDELVDAGL
ncbi:hypothetical protein BASA81_002123 [Batrachochytrium salamandrivorans]|nr:hypothetical protein BASA81_002123 [Batrachochytrium salamandrivorans]